MYANNVSFNDKRCIKMCLIALLAGDIETNPGPRKPKYPCQICHKAAKWWQQAIECDHCKGWFHKSCVCMSDNIYQVLAVHPSYSWSCCNCAMPNFSTTFFESHDLELSNSFSSLGDSLSGSASNPFMTKPDTSPGVPLLTSSPNTLTSNRYQYGKWKPTGKPFSKSKVANLKIININCQSVRAKQPSFEVMLATEDPDVVVGTESWLTESIATREIFPSHYNVFRRDRLTNNLRGGGVFIAVKDTLIASLENNLQTNCESIWISIHVQGLSPVFIGAFYRPPSSDNEYINELDLSLSKIPQNASVWLLGDFNLPDINWDSVEFKPCGQYPSIIKSLINIINPKQSQILQFEYDFAHTLGG